MGRTPDYLTSSTRPAAAHVPAQRRAVVVGAADGRLGDPTTELRGPLDRPLLSALAQAYASTGTPRSRPRATTSSPCWRSARRGPRPAGFNTGYLSAYPESFIDRVEARQTCGRPTTPSQDHGGLLDMHLLAGNAQALTVLTGMAAG
jgi:hypothetical protein